MDGTIRLVVKAGGEDHPVDLCHKQVLMGDVPVRQVWADIRTLYRPGDHPNSTAMLSYFWDLCRAWGTASEPGVRESYLLARLLPMSRALGSRRILPDGRYGPARVAACAKVRAEAVACLQGLLVADREAGPSRVAFRDRTAGLLEIPVPDDRTIALYDQLCDELFGKARAIVVADPDGAVAVMVNRWERATRGWGRRNGHKLHKEVMDYLSYECRVAFHRCYSAFWLDAMTPIARRLHLACADLRLLHLWHLDHGSEGQSPDLPFHWFHGHVLALHPASALLMATEAGRAILGRYLSCGPVAAAEEPFGHILRAMQHAIYAYMLHRDEVRQARKISA